MGDIREEKSASLDVTLEEIKEGIRKLQDIAYLTDRKEVTQETIYQEIIGLIEAIKYEFERACTFVSSKIEMKMTLENFRLNLDFSCESDTASIAIPLPSLTDNGIEILKNGDVERVLCDYWLEKSQERVRYLDSIRILICDDANKIFPHLEVGRNSFTSLIKSFDKNQSLIVANGIQRMINDIVCRMPLFETDMNSWVMNSRIMIIDENFDSISDPAERLNYQVEKNRKYYDKFGWTAIGLSDGVLADKNYLLSMDLRKFTPFGLYHNPQRNLYSTLGMKGDEVPRIRSDSMQKLMDKGITRKGWNLFTVILDVPLNFEDQIIVNKRLAKKSHTIKRRFIVQNDHVAVKVGDTIKHRSVLGYSADGQAVRNTLRCDEAKIVSLRKDFTLINAIKFPITIVTVEGRRYFRDGTKFSNLHGNKGIIRLAETGVAIDPRTGKEREIDVIISAKSVNKRKNFGQVIEALVNNLYEDKEFIVVKDYFEKDIKDLRSKLQENGFPADGSWMCKTQWGDLSGIAGLMFWGVTKDPEDAIWDADSPKLTDNRELRTSGLKFSHVELKALVTRFGPNNPIIKEILAKAQGVEILQDEFRILNSAKGEIDPRYPVIDAKDVKAVNVEDEGLFHDLVDIKGTVVDDEYFSEGFTLRLPIYFQVIVDKNDPEKYTWGLPQEIIDKDEKKEYLYNTIFIPNSLIRRCWRHSSGKWGLNPIGVLINSIIISAHRVITDKCNANARNLALAIGRYFSKVSTEMGTKRGEISTYGMAIRYPLSTRGTAALSNDLEPNTIEIYRDMAEILKVKTGDAVLAERFPCLGFMSIRPQWVKVTDDPMCKYVIRVSNNSLVSMNLDFDGDTLFLAGFETIEAKERLKEELRNPNKICKDAIDQLNSKKVPIIMESSLDSLNVHIFPKPTNDEHAELVRKATGVKSHTGPVIALAYNLMRIVERNVPYTNTTAHAHLELLLDFLGNTVFKQKHGIKSLQEEATDAICVADVNGMVKLGFDEEPSKLLCDLIKKEAQSIGITNLQKYHEYAKKRGASKIINLIVRKKHKVYFASRSIMGPFALLEHLNAPPCDLPSFILYKVLRTDREKIEDKIENLKAERMKIRNVLTDPNLRDLYSILSEYLDKITCNTKTKEVSYGA